MNREWDRHNNPYYARMMSGPVGHFGSFLMERSYDVGMDSAIGTLDGKWEAEPLKALTRRLKSLSEDQREAVLALTREALVAALHGFLHGVSEGDDRIRLTFEGQDLASASDGLQGDLFFWLRDLSRHPYDVDS